MYRKRPTDICPTSMVMSGKDVFLRIISLISLTRDETLVSSSVTKNKRDMRGKQNRFSAFLSPMDDGSSSENSKLEGIN